MLTRSLAISGIVEPVTGAAGGRAGPRELIEWAAELGYRAVQLDGAMQGLRARDLDRSGRRDLAALLKRLGLGLSGVDLWVPPGHYLEGGQIERAAEATLDALTLAGELARLVNGGTGVLNVAFPDTVSEDLVAFLAGGGDRDGARLADHQWPPAEWKTNPGSVGVGIDPWLLVRDGVEVGSAVSRLKEAPLAARLNDLRDGMRVAAGTGKLDVLGYEIALETKGFGRMLVVDVKGVRGQREAAQRGIER